MKYLILSQNKFWFKKNLKNELDLCAMPLGKEIEKHSFPVCILRDGHPVKVVNMEVLLPDLVPLDISNKKQLSGDAFWAVKAYFIKALLSDMANMMEGVNKQSMLKIIGMIEPIFRGELP